MTEKEEMLDEIKKARAKRDGKRSGSDAGPVGLSEDDLARIFSQQYADTLRYVDRWGKWMSWNGQVWVEDDTLAVFDKIRETVREHGSSKQHRAQTITAVQTLARSDRRHAATTDQWDENDWLLNTPGGMVDLKTGDIQPHDTGAHCTKITAATPAADDACPRWLEFLNEVTNSDLSLIAFLQRLAGYAATGSVSEHMLAFLWGTGRNGKGVFLNTLQNVLKDYAVTAGMDVFTESRGDKHPTELAALQGARLVVAQETDEGRYWNEARIKALTGGDSITARYMRQDFFTFEPKFTLIIAGNHKPRLRNIDEAMRSRLHLVPFTVTIPKEKRDPDLVDKLRDEYPGILRWIIDGAIEFQRIGLAPPAVVTEATAEYMDGEDVFQQWIADRCERGLDLWDPAGTLFTSWRHYAQEANERVGSQKGFSERMVNAGFAKGKTGSRGRHWVGLKVRDLLF